MLWPGVVEARDFTCRRGGRANSHGGARRPVVPLPPCGAPGCGGIRESADRCGGVRLQLVVCLGYLLGIATWAELLTGHWASKQQRVLKIFCIVGGGGTAPASPPGSAVAW